MTEYVAVCIVNGKYESPKVGAGSYRCLFPVSDIQFTLLTPFCFKTVKRVDIQEGHRRREVLK